MNVDVDRVGDEEGNLCGDDVGNPLGIIGSGDGDADGLGGTEDASRHAHTRLYHASDGCEQISDAFVSLGCTPGYQQPMPPNVSIFATPKPEKY